MRKKKMKHSKTISFDEEIVPKHIAEKILAEEPKIITGKWENVKRDDNEDINEDVSRKGNKKKPKKRKIMEHEPYVSEQKNDCHQDQSQEEEKPALKKHKKKKKEQEESLTEETSNTNKEENEQHRNQKKESIRAMKRKKHAQLLEEKKLKAELAMQQKALNYLSKWKHSREEWKFEKLKQIWLQHNIYDTAKIPEEFWNVLVEYLSNSKGKARNLILQEALKLIENCSEEDNEYEIKVKRARDIVQNLQE